MAANFIDLDSLDKLDQLFDLSHSRPVVIFKHSMSCGISSGVFRIVSNVPVDVHLLVVQTCRSVSNELASRCGVRHESPQALVIAGGKPVYFASHYDITADAITSAVGLQALPGRA